jgi:hypothetical protein
VACVVDATRGFGMRKGVERGKSSEEVLRKRREKGSVDGVGGCCSSINKTCLVCGIVCLFLGCGTAD